MLPSIPPVVALTAVLALVPGGVALAQAGQPEEIVSCVVANMPQGDELRSISLTTRDRANVERVTRADVFARHTGPGSSRTLITMTEPAELEGSAVLILEDQGSTDLWIHAPDVGRRRLETGTDQAQSLLGTGLSYEDLGQLLGFVRTQSERLKRLDDDWIGDRATFVLESTPDPGTSAYQRIVTSVDKKTCVPLEAKLYEKVGAAPRKVATTDPDQIFRVHSTWIAHTVTLWDHRDEKQTVLHIESVMPGLTLPDVAFSPSSLGTVKPRIDVEITFDPIEIN